MNKLSLSPSLNCQRFNLAITGGILIAFYLSFFFSSIIQAQNEKETMEWSETRNTLIKSGSGYGLIKVGKTSLKEIKKELGKGEVKKYKVKREKIKIEHRFVNYETIGIEFDFNGHNILQSIWFNENSEMRTIEGITIGKSDKNDVIALYGNPDDKFIDVNAVRDTTYIYSNIGISFSFTNDKVTGIRIFCRVPLLPHSMIKNK